MPKNTCKNLYVSFFQYRIKNIKLTCSQGKEKPVIFGEDKNDDIQTSITNINLKLEFFQIIFSL